MDTTSAHQEQALGLAEETGDVGLQTRISLALSASLRGGLVLMG
jgi:hypothetical protein